MGLDKDKEVSELKKAIAKMELGHELLAKGDLKGYTALMEETREILEARLPEDMKDADNG